MSSIVDCWKDGPALTILVINICEINGKMENGSILLAPQMTSLDSVASAADGIQKEA